MLNIVIDADLTRWLSAVLCAGLYDRIYTKSAVTASGKSVSHYLYVSDLSTGK